MAWVSSLWEQIAKEMDVEYTIENHRLMNYLMRLKPEQIDIVVFCISITPRNVSCLLSRLPPFSHSFYGNSPCHRSEETGLPSYLARHFSNPCIVDDHWCYRFYLWGHWRIFSTYWNTARMKKLYSMKSRTGRWLESSHTRLTVHHSRPIQLLWV